MNVKNFLLVLIVTVLMTQVMPAQNFTRESDRWERSNEAVVLSDMSRVVPKSALADVRTKRHWKVLEYETKDGLSGKSIASMPDTGAPNVTLPLNTKGWHAVYVGLNGPFRVRAGEPGTP